MKSDVWQGLTQLIDASENHAVQFGSVVRDQSGLLLVSEQESNMTKIAFEEG